MTPWSEDHLADAQKWKTCHGTWTKNYCTCISILLRDHIMISDIRMIYTFVYTYDTIHIHDTSDKVSHHFMWHQTILSCHITSYDIISFHLISCHLITDYIRIISYWHHITSQSHQIGRYGSSQTASSHISHHVITSHLIPWHRITLWWHHIITTSHHYLTSFHTTSHIIWHYIIWHYIWHYCISCHLMIVMVHTTTSISIISRFTCHWAELKKDLFGPKKWVEKHHGFLLGVVFLGKMFRVWCFSFPEWCFPFPGCFLLNVDENFGWLVMFTAGFLNLFDLARVSFLMFPWSFPCVQRDVTPKQTVCRTSGPHWAEIGNSFFWPTKMIASPKRIDFWILNKIRITYGFLIQ